MTQMDWLAMSVLTFGLATVCLLIDENEASCISFCASLIAFIAAFTDAVQV